MTKISQIVTVGSAVIATDKFEKETAGGQSQQVTGAMIKSFTLSGNPVGNRNTSNGFEALLNNTGDDNTAFGDSALKTNVSGAGNVAVGVWALKANTGSYNVAVGAYALEINTTGGENIVVGSAMLVNTIGSFNVAIGEAVLSSSVSGDSNVAIGHSSMYLNTTGDNNVAIGFQSLYTNNTNLNVAIGYRAGEYETAGSKFFIDASASGRTDEATARSQSLLYGVFGATPASQKLTVNAALIGGSAALATTATDGFWHVPSCAGVPTGVPTAYTGTIPLVADSTNNKLYIYSGGNWVALN